MLNIKKLSLESFFIARRSISRVLYVLLRASHLSSCIVADTIERFYMAILAGNQRKFVKIAALQPTGFTV